MEGFNYIKKKKPYFFSFPVFKVMRGEIESNKKWKTRVLRNKRSAMNRNSWLNDRTGRK